MAKLSAINKNNYRIEISLTDEKDFAISTVTISSWNLKKSFFSLLKRGITHGQGVSPQFNWWSLSRLL